MSVITFSVFTKPWKTPLAELGQYVRDLGFDAIELPVRPGYQVTPENVARDLPRAVATLASCGVSIASVAGPMDEATIAACAEAGVPIIRVCLDIPRDRDYLSHEAAIRREFDRLEPLLTQAGVAIGVQNHSGRYVANAMGLRHLLEPYDPRQFCAVLDLAHCALNGEIPELALDIAWPHLRMVNLKNAYWRRANDFAAEVAQYERRWTSGRQGLCSWPVVVAELRRRDYQGVVCLTAEYSDQTAVDRLIAEDIAFAKALFVG
ncbi:MAG: sugar phosphate isomerase/epimerase family protein [Thermomicrobiales bacterium]